MYQSVFPETDLRSCFNTYLTVGGMPYLSNLRYEDEPCRQYLMDLYNSVELKDIVKRHKIRDVDLLERIAAYVTANIGMTFSASSLSKYIKNEGRRVAPETILNYLKAGVDAYLFYQVKRQDLQGKRILSVQEKYYIADHGIREAVFGAYDGIADNYPKYVVSLDDFDRGSNGIKHCHIRDFLLMEQWS